MSGQRPIPKFYTYNSTPVLSQGFLRVDASLKSPFTPKRKSVKIQLGKLYKKFFLTQDFIV